jgi:hypothetical protein
MRDFTVDEPFSTGLINCSSMLILPWVEVNILKMLPRDEEYGQKSNMLQTKLLWLLFFSQWLYNPLGA